MSEQKKAILMMHTDQEQGQLWHTALESQQLDIIWESTAFDLVQYLEKCDRYRLPSLLLIDMAIKSPTSQTLQSSSVCQWVNKQQVPIKIVLFNPRQERIKDIEHSWALRRGAADVLPRLSRENLMAEVTRVTALIGCSLNSQPLEKIAEGLASSSVSTPPKENNLFAVQDINSLKSISKSNPKSNSKGDSKSDPAEAVMYRGVRIRR
jgi:hypothetical protein